MNLFLHSEGCFCELYVDSFELIIVHFQWNTLVFIQDLFTLTCSRALVSNGFPPIIHWVEAICRVVASSRAAKLDKWPLLFMLDKQYECLQYFFLRHSSIISKTQLKTFLTLVLWGNIWNCICFIKKEFQSLNPKQVGGHVGKLWIDQKRSIPKQN